MNALKMSNTDVTESLCSEWDGSSQNRNPDEKNNHDDPLIIQGTVLEDTIPFESGKTDASSNTISTSSPNETSKEAISDYSVCEDSSSDYEISAKKSKRAKSSADKSKKKRTKQTTPLDKRTKPKGKTQTKKTTKNTTDKPEKLPSVYSRNQIARHTKRMNKLKALEQESDSEVGSEPDTDAVLDRDLDINLRIFEESAQSVDNMVIGEIQCNILDDKSCTEIINNANKNPPNVFKLSVNTNFVENCDIEKSLEKSFPDGNSNIDDIEMSDDPLDFSDNDSDFEILVSKPIIRKRAAQPVKKEKPTEKKQKLTMYDLIHDSVLASPKKEESSDNEQKQEDLKTNETKKTKVTNKKTKLKKEEPVDDSKDVTENREERNQHLPVPKLKVNADGEVVIDMDSLVIEQTGVSEARNAIANSEAVEEHSLSYKSYNKKNCFRKQWTPHETLKFYQVLSTIGTDFTLMATLFAGRTRKCMKRKFKREEKTNADLIMKALSCKQNFNIDLLEKELQLKDEKVNQFKENSKKQQQKPVKKKTVPSAEKKGKFKRKSFFEKSVSSFRND